MTSKKTTGAWNGFSGWNAFSGLVFLACDLYSGKRSNNLINLGFHHGLIIDY